MALKAPFSVEATNTGEIRRLRVVVRGAVQGVGFRPFLYRLASELKLPGWARNSSEGVLAEVEGEPRILEIFLLRIESEKPPHSYITGIEPVYLDAAGFQDFSILPSDDSGVKTALVLPDIAVCPECIEEIFDPANRRYLYPFTNCTHCGPRYSIIAALPYDRPNTSMRVFQMCQRCRAEYENPADRRFHAQPNACPQCGPQLELWDGGGSLIAEKRDALLSAADAVKAGKIVAVKGLGGFHLVADAGNDEAVSELRLRKAREEKPFALMYHSLEAVEEACEVSAMERRLLLSPECPIVLLKRKRGLRSTSGVAEAVAPGNPHLGIMLPYTPLHHILMRELGFPVAATSGNLSDEPICIDEREALERLGAVADLFLIHNRRILRGVDDSIVRVVLGRELTLRRARGYAPLPLKRRTGGADVLAVGGHLKNTIALAKGENVFLSQHLGDLETAAAYRGFRDAVDSFQILFDVKPEAAVCDLHPDYFSTGFAEKTGLETLKVQHHYAHILSCMAENEIEAPALGVAWDGTGYGLDGTIWGGEFLLVEGAFFRRAAHFRTFPLPGGDIAAREPRRSALGLLYEIFGEEVFRWQTLPTLKAFTALELKNLRRMLKGGINSPKTSSAGRLFDAAASILDVRHISGYEGSAAMEMEYLTDGADASDKYQYIIREGNSPWVIDWAPMFRMMIYDLLEDVPLSSISARFHFTLSEFIVDIALRAGLEKVALSGGCFQNKCLTELAVNRLMSEGFKPYWHQRVPPNDGGIALGQVAAVKHIKG